MSLIVSISDIQKETFNQYYGKLLFFCFKEKENKIFDFRVTFCGQCVCVEYLIIIYLHFFREKLTVEGYQYFVAMISEVLDNIDHKNRQKIWADISGVL